MLGLCRPDEKRVMHVHVQHKSSSPMGVSIYIIYSSEVEHESRIWSLNKNETSIVLTVTPAIARLLAQSST
jgi:hypothetical protein